MRVKQHFRVRHKVVVAALGLLLPLPALRAPAPARVAAPRTPAPIVLGPRHGHVTPVRKGCNHTAGGNIDVAQPSPDTVVITMTGVAVATKHPVCTSVASMAYELEQCFEVSFDNPKL